MGFQPIELRLEADATIEDKEIVYASRRRNHVHQLRTIGCGAKSHHALISRSYISGTSRRDVEKRKISPSFFRTDFDEPFSICGPDWLVNAARTGRSAVADNESIDVEIK